MLPTRTALSSLAWLPGTFCFPCLVHPSSHLATSGSGPWAPALRTTQTGGRGRLWAGKGRGLRLYLAPHTRHESVPYFKTWSPSSWLKCIPDHMLGGPGSFHPRPRSVPRHGKLLVGRGTRRLSPRRQGDTGGHEAARPSRRGDGALATPAWCCSTREELPFIEA